jgi:L-alanine-DL-glutamate epimerase-like enolase superfamily enzyme
VTTIKTVESRLVRMPLKTAAMFATRSVATRDYLLVRLTDSDGAQGIGLTYAGSSAGSVVQEAVEALLSPLLIGAPGYLIEGLWDRMYRVGLLHGRAGSVMRALSALDVALWDLNARAAGVPLWRFLGAHADGVVPAYASGGYYGNEKTPDHLAEEMRGYVALGFKAVKMKVGLQSPAQDEERLARVREAVGPDIDVYLDANNAWPDMLTALRHIRRFEPYRPGWIEEPFSPDDIESHARLAQATSIPVATGEIEAGRWRFRSILDARAAQVLQTDALVCGGITEWRRIAAVASAYGVPVCPHAWHNVHVHLTASVPNSPMAEYFVDDGIIGFQPLFDQPMEARDGLIRLPTTPGLGFGFNEDTLAAHGTSDWRRSGA